MVKKLIVTILLITSPALGDDIFNIQLDKAIDRTSKRYLDTKIHTPWQIFHYILAMKNQSLIVHDGEKINAINWISQSNPKYYDEPWIIPGPAYHHYTASYVFEGHPGQFLALLSELKLPTTHTIQSPTGTVIIGEMVDHLAKSINHDEELSWILWTLQAYYPIDKKWVAYSGENWTIEKLVQIEVDEPINGAACGGNHRLFALTRTLHKYLENNRLRGTWLLADHKIRYHIELAKSYQNKDGSFSSAFYEKPAFTTNIADRVDATGHILEFLVISLPKNRLNERWVKNAITSLCNDLTHEDIPIGCGPIYHALNALIMYKNKMSK